VPPLHGLRAYNALACANGFPAQAFSEAQLAAIASSRRVPAEVLEVSAAVASNMPPEAFAAETRQRPILLRRTAGPVRLTLFAGGHESDFPAALDWLSTHSLPSPS